MNKKQQPLVSCIMPTYNRREFIPHAIRYFLSQDYENKELIIIDDGSDNIRELVPDVETIRYFSPGKKMTLGAKLNLACTYAGGSIIANWDDDDWYATRRLTYQVDTLQNEGTEVCGINKLLYYDLRIRQAYQYIYPPDQRTWLLGSSLCYTRELWNRNHFAEINVGMDGLFVWGTSSNRITVLPDSTIAVHMIHNSNVSPKKTDSKWWHTYPVDDIKKIMKTDWSFYHNRNLIPAKKNITLKENIQARKTVSEQAKFQNVYACLVHENEDCVIDLVRNLHYHDPASAILLYNGGQDPGLIQRHFSYDKFGAVIHPAPVPVKHGYLHHFALSCMQFALENFSFDCITIVDSDQLAIRSGYSEYLGKMLPSLSNIGMLSSKPRQITPKDKDDKEVWPAMQAYNEYDLWKPFLQSFPDGENKFVHWTFWPSTVFTVNAVKGLIQLFKNNRQLQQIMKKTGMWATEEIILPTLVKLLGFDIVSNPCSYDFVKYQKSYTRQDISNALNKKDAYWIHPIERTYENQHRKYIRDHFNHYGAKNGKKLSKKICSLTWYLPYP